MNASRSLFFTALGLFDLYAVEFRVVGCLPAIIAHHGISVTQADCAPILGAPKKGLAALAGHQPFHPSSGSSRLLLSGTVLLRSNRTRP
jgi:hypothetical protein